MADWNYDSCPDTAYGNHSPLDVYGKCSWCGRKVGPTQHKPKSGIGRSNLGLAYDYYYDPNYGMLDSDRY